MSAPARPRPAPFALTSAAYRRSLARLDMRHALKVLAVEDAALSAGPKAPTCRCSGGWTDDGQTCGKCGHVLEEAPK